MKNNNNFFYAIWIVSNVTLFLIGIALTIIWYNSNSHISWFRYLFIDEHYEMLSMLGSFFTLINGAALFVTLVEYVSKKLDN